MRNDEAIVIRGARVHNLKGIDVSIPRDRLVVITGPSGSGKSSLAFDTVFAEGQRRYVESLSTYARQFIPQNTKPDVESISGLSPTISIQQKTTNYNPRSTVGTVTEVYDYLRVVYARLSKPFCWNCGDVIQSQSQQQIVDQILAQEEGTKLALLAPVVRDRKGEYQKELTRLRQQGFVRAKVDGMIHDLSESISLDRNKKHEISVYVDRIVLKGDRNTFLPRVSESVELALRLGEGQMILEIPGSSGKTEEILYSEKFACNRCHISYPEPEPRLFSFNSARGACPECDGLGLDRKKMGLDKDGANEKDSDDSANDSAGPVSENVASRGRMEIPCGLCAGGRLRKESLHFRLGGKNIYDLTEMPLSDLQNYFSTLSLSARENQIGDRILKEIKERLDFLARVGVSYLSLGRKAQTLSGGEAQRIRLATQLGSSLVGVIYILDEPSIGLHPSDHTKLLGTLEQLRDRGNTVLVVEHDQETMETADYLIDLGPGAGTRGGEVMALGTVSEIKKNAKSLTGKYLKGEMQIPVPHQKKIPASEHSIEISGLTANNLKEISARFPLGSFICVTGVSGSGKSTLVLDTLYPMLMDRLYPYLRSPHRKEPLFKKASGLEAIDKVVDIDQTPIGRTPRSNPATYTGIFSLIRDLFAQLPAAQVRGFKPGRFSFNVSAGRCESCEGGGMVRVEMHFLPDVYIPCDNCGGRRYNSETLEVRYKGKHIADVLAMTAEDALQFFDSIPQIKNRLSLLNEVGLGYLTLGQSATTLSGGEAQRLKLSRELARRGTGKTLYLLDEPSTGLHFDDIKKLLEILRRLVDQGNTVVVIEHNLDIIKTADYVIDMGPGGGGAGGYVIFQGSPEELVRTTPKTGSLTGAYLKKYLVK